MWIDYKDVMALLEVSHTLAYKVIAVLQEELKAKGYLVNPNRKVPIQYFCDRYGIDISDAKARIAEAQRIIA